MTTEPENSNPPTAPEASATAAPQDPQAKLQAERDQFYALLQQTAAEFDNFRKRTRKEKQEWQDVAVSGVASRLLPIFDNFNRAVSAWSKDQNPEHFQAGMAMILEQFKAFLSATGIEEIAVQPGMPFDPALHQAVASDPSSEHPAGRVAQVAGKGYKIKDRVIRHAEVAVSARGEAAGDAGCDAPAPDAGMADGGC